MQAKPTPVAYLSGVMTSQIIHNLVSIEVTLSVFYCDLCRCLTDNTIRPVGQFISAGLISVLYATIKIWDVQLHGSICTTKVK